MIENTTQLFQRLSSCVVSELPVTRELMNDILQYVLTQQKEHSEIVGKWIKNCDTLMEKLSENQN